jgi:hypothetical protein
MMLKFNGSSLSCERFIGWLHNILETLELCRNCEGFINKTWGPLYRLLHQAAGAQTAIATERIAAALLDGGRPCHVDTLYTTRTLRQSASRSMMMTLTTQTEG